MTRLVQIQLLGGLQVEIADPLRTITRFRSQNIAAVLAYLALYPGKMHTREELAYLIWPDADPRTDAARNNLRVALSSLRRQLEPPGVLPAGTVIATQGRARVGLNPVTTGSDAADFEELIRQSRRSSANSTAGEIAFLEKAVQLYRGPLLPGLYDEWVVPRRSQISSLFQNALTRLARLYEEAGDVERAKDYTHRATLENASQESGSSLVFYPSDAPAPKPPVVETITKQAKLASRPAMIAEPYAPRPGDTRHETEAVLRQTLRLPTFMTRFFGREAETEELDTLLRPRDAGGRTPLVSRLLTLIGPGGTGKTRLAVHLAERIAPFFPGGVYWVPLTDVPGSRQIPEAIADAIAATRGGRRTVTPNTVDPADPLGAVTAALSSTSPSLLVLDNFEHLVEEATPLVEQLLARTANLFCLVTSRQRLLLGTEREVPALEVPPLSAENPEFGQNRTPSQPQRRVSGVYSGAAPESLLPFPGVQLFVDRSQMARPDFQLTARNAAAVGALCARLDGLPLALELAAGWSLTLTPNQMLARLEERPSDLLVARRRDILPRHQSLQDVLQASFELLEPEIQELFSRLSVFRGTWTTEAARAVCFDNEAAYQDVLDGLSRLRERSLLLAEERGGSIRWRMLLLVRTFADEQLSASERAVTEARHASYFCRLAEAAEPHVQGGPSQSWWIDELEGSLDDVRVVLARSSRDSAQNDGGNDLVLRLLGALGWFLVVRSHWGEGLQWLRQALRDDNSAGAGGSGPKAEPSPTRVKALCAAAMLASAVNLFEECQSYCDQCLEICEVVDAPWGTAYATAKLGSILTRQGDFLQGCELLEKGLAGFRQIEDRWATSATLDNLAHACRDQQEYERAADLYTESLCLRRELADTQGIAMSLSNLADTEQLRGNWEQAAVLHEESLERFQRLGDKAGTGYCLRRLGECALWQGNIDHAQALGRESLALFRELGDERRIAECLEKTALVRHALGQSVMAVHLLGAASTIRDSIGMPLPPSEKQMVEEAVQTLRTNMNATAFECAWLQGQTMEMEALFALAMDH